MSKLRWIDKPAAMGLRFVGFADTIAKAFGSRAIGHSGWHTDDTFREDTFRGVVYQITGKRGRARYVAGYVRQERGESIDHDSAMVDLSRIIIGDRKAGSWDMDSALLSAARDSDYIAEREAETAREYSAAWRAGLDYAEHGEMLAQARQAALSLVAELKRAGPQSPAICDAIRSRLSSLVHTWRKSKVTRVDLANIHNRPRRPDLVSAFLDGAGLHSFPAH